MVSPILRLTADRERCVGSGACAFAEPGVFDQDDADGRVILLTSKPGSALHESVRNAVDSCPVAALGIDQSAG